jgi:flavodoxin
MNKRIIFLTLALLAISGLGFAQSNKKVLVLYYSYTGNTKLIAQEIQKKLGASTVDLVEVQPVVPYSSDYDKVVDQGHQEVNKGYEPKIKPLGVNIADYDVIVIGTPVWWYHVASPIKTLLSQNNWQGKTVFTYATNAGWIGKTFSDFETGLKGATIKSKMNILFGRRGSLDSIKTPQEEIDTWIDSIKNN